jgi:chromate transporter
MSTQAKLPTRRALFTGFLLVGMLGFGGVLPWARRMMVDVRGWVSDQEFTELLSLGQLLPGPNVVNLSVVYGARCHGPTGSILAVTGLMAVPLVAVLALVALYDHFGHLQTVTQALSGVSAAAAGLVLGTGLRLALTMDRRGWMIALVALTFAAIALLRLPLLAVLGGLIPLGVALGYRSMHKGVNA